MGDYKIVLADDHVILRHGIKQMIDEADGLRVAGEAGDGAELLKLLKTIEPDMIVLDITMPNMRGLEAAAEIKMSYPRIKIMILTMHKSTQYLHSAFASGAEGYLLKEDAPLEVFNAIETMRQGNYYISPLLLNELTEEMAQAYKTGQNPFQREPLTARERQVLKLIAEEKSNRGISEILNISPFTVQRHRASIKNKLNIRTTAGLVKYAIRKGYTTSD